MPPAERLLLGPGPSPVAPRVTRAMQAPALSHLDPAMMFVHGVNDPRVDVWQSSKGAARFQAASTSGKPVLLRLDAQAGHGIGSTVTQRQRVKADLYAFLLWQMGKLPATP